MKNILTLFIFLLSSITIWAQEDKRPNIILILADDIGFEEFGIYDVKKGEESNTPNIDNLGREGVTFKTAWAQSICGPSRAMIYSGNYAMHNGAYDNKVSYIPNEPKFARNMQRMPNFIRVLHDAGYKTAVAGKWHNPIGGTLGVHNKLLGVDNYVVYNSQPDKIEKITSIKLTPDEYWETAALSKEPILSRYWKPAYVQDGKLLETTMEDYGPDILTNYLCNFIEENASNEQPFLAFYPMVLAHSSHCVTPLEVAEGAEPSNEHFPSGKGIGAEYFKSQIAYADILVGKIVAKVKEMGIEDETIIIFTSDNGTTASAKSKGVEYGVHIPFIVAGAGIKQRGMTSELTDFTDVLPTLADFANATIPAKYNVDGVSLEPFLTGESETTKPIIYAQPGLASLVRTKDYLLEAVCPQYGHPEGRFYKTNSSYDGRGYENITHDPAHKEQRIIFQGYLNQVHSLVPDSFDDPIWQEKYMLRGYKHFTHERRRRSHLSLPINYRFYDPSF